MSDEFHPGDALGDYRLDVRLGGGGFGSVWKATDQTTSRIVALKILRTDVYSSDTTRLRSEVELLAATASSRSPHVVKVFGGGSEPSPYVVMEFIDGVDLGRELERRKRIPQIETIRIGAAVANALSALESVGIIHRDIKPANVMIDVDGVVKLTDFGIAKIVGFDTITATSQMPMSMAYAAPEVWEGTASHKSDLYSLGILLFQCLAGRPPFTGSYAQVYRQHASKDPDWTLLPEGTVPTLRDLLRGCLAKSESDRPANAAVVTARLTEAEAELEARLQSAPTPDLPIHEPQAFGPWLRRGTHPTQPWGFLCVHETTAEKATVEIHFSDDIEYGARLRKAVEVNPKLVPLGAERLLGTNRLVLRPGEAWTTAPPGQFQFWVAREELPLRPAPDSVDDALLSKAAAALAALTSAAKDAGLELCLPPGDLRLQRNESVVLLRPGLATAGDDGMIWLRSLRLDGPVRTIVSRERNGGELAAQSLNAGVASPGGDSNHSIDTTLVTSLQHALISEIAQEPFVREPREESKMGQSESRVYDMPRQSGEALALAGDRSRSRTDSMLTHSSSPATPTPVGAPRLRPWYFRQSVKFGVWTVTALLWPWLSISFAFGIWWLTDQDNIARGILSLTFAVIGGLWFVAQTWIAANRQLGRSFLAAFVHGAGFSGLLCGYLYGISAVSWLAWGLLISPVWLIGGYVIWAVTLRRPRAWVWVLDQTAAGFWAFPWRWCRDSQSGRLSKAN